MSDVPPLRSKLLLARSSSPLPTPLRKQHSEQTWMSDEDKERIRGRSINAYLSHDDVARVRRLAASRNMSVSAYVRLVVTSHLDEVA